MDTDRDKEANYDKAVAELAEIAQGRTDALTFQFQNAIRDDTRAKDLCSVRFGPEPNQTSMLVMTRANMEIAQVTGIPTGLLHDGADGGARRES